MENLVFIVKKEFILLYSKRSFIQTFHERIIQSIQDHQYIILEDQNKKNFVLNQENKKIYIPEIPEFGDLVYDEIINSNYMIS